MSLVKFKSDFTAVAVIAACFVAQYASAAVITQEGFETSRASFVADDSEADYSEVTDYLDAADKPAAVADYPFNESGYGSKYLAVDTGDTTLRHSFATSSSSVYFDAMMKFTTTEDGDVEYDADAKFTIYLDSATSNLCAVSGTSANDHTAVTNRLVTAPIVPGTWGRLTVNAVRSNGVFAFQVRLNGTLLSTAGGADTFYSLTADTTMSEVSFTGCGALDNVAVRTTDPFFSGTVAATIGGENGEKYASLEDAIADANGATVTLRENAAAISTPLAAGTSYSIAKNGYTFGGFAAASGAVISESTYNGVTTYVSVVPLSSDSISTPIAVWNGDFASDNVDRGKFKQYMFSNSVSDGVVTLDSSSRPLILELAAYTNVFPFMAVVGLSDIPVPTGDSVFSLIRAYAFTSSWIEAPGVFINSSGKFAGDWNGTRSYGVSASAYAPASEGTMDFVALSYKYDDATKVYLNGDLFYSSNAMRDSTLGYWRSFAIGGAYNSGITTWRANGMKVGYAVVLAANTQADAAFWSLKSIKNHETLASSATSFAGGDAIGVNLNGGTIAVSSAQTVAALFVQEDTTLKFTGTGSLSTTYNGSYRGPVYVADGKTLTIDLSDATVPSSGNVSDLVTASIFGNVVITGYTSPAVLSNSGLRLGATGDAAPSTTSGGTVKFFSDGDCTVVPQSGNTATFDFDGVAGKVIVEYATQPTQSGSVFTATTVPTWLTDSTKWTGVICLNGATVADFTSNIYGNDSSLVRLKNVSGHLNAPGNYPFTNTVPVEIVGTFTINNGNSANDANPNRCTVFKKLSGNGTISANSTANKVVVVIQDASEFTGDIGLNGGKIVVFGETMPVYEKLEVATIFVMEGTCVTVNGFWWATGGKVFVDGELRASGLDKFGGGTYVTTSDNGVFTLINSNDTQDHGVNYARITGRGTLRYADVSGKWRTLSMVNFPTNMVCENNLSSGLILQTTGALHTIGSLSGNGQIRSDWGGSGSTGDRDLRILQAKDTTYYGLFAANNDRINNVIVAPGTGSSPTGTLTLSGVQTASNGLTVESGAKVNITGTWKGATTVAGTLGGNGEVTGNLTLSDGAALVVDDMSDLLTVNGDFTTASGTVKIYLPAETRKGTKFIDVTGTITIDSGTKFEVYVGNELKRYLSAKALKDGSGVKITCPPVQIRFLSASPSAAN